MIDYIHTQLSIWAKWSVCSEAKGVGYSPICPMFKDSRHGGAYGSAPPPGIFVGGIENIRDTDAAVKRLGREQKSLCFEFYVIGGKSDDIASRVGVSKKKLYQLIHALHQSILGHINDVAAGY